MLEFTMTSTRIPKIEQIKNLFQLIERESLVKVTENVENYLEMFRCC